MELRGVLESTDVAEIQAEDRGAERGVDGSWPTCSTPRRPPRRSRQAAGGDGDGGAAEDEVVEDADYEVIDEEEAKTS